MQTSSPTDTERLPGQAAPQLDQYSESMRAFEFVQMLASELSQGRIDLPSYPDVAIRVRHVLEDENVTNDRVARVVGSDAGLATRVLAMSNSAALSRDGKPITDLKMAVTRIGHLNVRSAALAYALGQIRSATRNEAIRSELADLWEKSTLVAALTRVLAIRFHAANPDEAQLAGLLHNIGRVYILARADRHSDLFDLPGEREELMRNWHAHIGKAIAQNWGLPETVSDAIGEQDAFDRADCTRDLIDLLCVSIRMAEFRGPVEELEKSLASLLAYRRLGIRGDALREVMAQAGEEIASLRAALGG